MRILVASLDFLPRIGGVSLMCHYMANELAREGHEVLVYGPVGSRALPDYPALYEIFAEKPASSIGLIEKRKREIGLWQSKIFKDFKRLHFDRSFDRVLLLQPFVYGWPALRLQKECGVPVSVFFHGYELRSKLLQDDSPAVKLHSAITGVVSPRSEFLAIAREADEVLTNSRYTANLVQSIKGHRPPKVTGCGLDEDVIAAQFPLSQSIDAAARIKNRAALGMDARPTLGFVGRLQESKGLRMLLKLIHDMPDVQGLIVGSGNDADWHKLASDLNVASRVRFLGSVDEKMKWDALRCMDVSCLFSRELPSGHVEGFGISILEAAAAGSMVAITRSGGMVDVVQNNDTGFVFEVDDVKTASQVLGGYLKNPKSYDYMITNMRSRIEKDFNWSTITQKLSSGWQARPSSDENAYRSA